jgi:hypothetical protein
MSEVLLGLADGPDAPELSVTLEDFLSRPEWHQRGRP